MKSTASRRFSSSSSYKFGNSLPSSFKSCSTPASIMLCVGSIFFLCRCPLMREKCFGGVVAGVEPASIGALPIGLRAPCGFHREFLPQAYSLARR
ncbi:hypothetical protein CKV37_003413 [Salmonella enterica subsp. enterica serovar Cerro]|nr:hypothetical protein [Salmonella enterica subsp. enterica serovar Cerro]EDT1499675.1 hypothetical protein [Salmonella enterica subsp. enterica serovar Cerro]EDW5049898.1 hypothetical protein [Salmonella enterica subsp. enterica serovar Cerro]EGZ3799585.1 hypothetical protein [Salmonella enterica subsp. enterica serovar Cerro]